MKPIITLIFLFILPISMIAQEVILDSHSMTDEQKRIQKVEEEIRKLEDDYSKASEQYESTFNKLSPLQVVLNPTKAKLEKKLQDIEQTQYEMQRQSLKGKCKQINNLLNSIGKDFNYCPSLESQTRRLNERHKEIRNEMVSLQKKQSEKETEKLTVGFDGNNTRDKYWNGITDKRNRVKNNDDDFWNGKPEKVADENKDDDFWNGKSENAVVENNEDDFWNGKVSTDTKPNNKITANKEVAPIIELYTIKYGSEILRYIESKEEFLKSIGYLSPNGYFPSKIFDYFEVYSMYGLKSENQNSADNIDDDKSHYLFDNQGNTLIEEAERIFVRDENIEIWFYKSLVYNKITKNGYGKRFKQYKKNYIIYTYDSQMNLLSKKPFFVEKYYKY